MILAAARGAELAVQRYGALRGRLASGKSCGRRGLSASSGGSFVALFPQEKRINIQDPVVTTATTFSGQAPVDYLEKRCHEILAANPWLGGRLRTDPTSNEAALFVPNELDERERAGFYAHEFCTNENGVDEISPFSCLQEVFGKPPPLRPGLSTLFCKQGYRSLDVDDEPLFKIRLCTAKDPNHFLLLVSMCHVIGDGYTYYEVYKMLNPGNPIIALNPKRSSGFPTSLGEVHSAIPGGNLLPPDYQSKPTHPTASPIAQRKLDWVLENKLLSEESLLQEPPKRLGFGMRYIDMGWLAKQKNAFVAQPGDPSFCSSNDVLVSWFFNVNQVDGGAFAVNGRRRIANPCDAGVSDLSAGNYQFLSLLFPEEFATPGAVRKALSSDRPGANQPEPGPGTRFAMLSNWSSTCENLNFPDARQIAHFPLAPAELGMRGMREPGAIIFAPHAGSLAIAGASVNWNEMDKSGALGGNISLFE